MKGLPTMIGVLLKHPMCDASLDAFLYGQIETEETSLKVLTTTGTALLVYTFNSLPS